MIDVTLRVSDEGRTAKGERYWAARWRFTPEGGEEQRRIAWFVCDAADALRFAIVMVTPRVVRELRPAPVHVIGRMEPIAGRRMHCPQLGTAHHGLPHDYIPGECEREPPCLPLDADDMQAAS